VRTKESAESEYSYSFLSSEQLSCGPSWARSHGFENGIAQLFYTRISARRANREKRRNPSSGVQLFSNLAKVVPPPCALACGFETALAFNFLLNKFWRAAEAEPGQRCASTGPAWSGAVSAAGSALPFFQRRHFYFYKRKNLLGGFLLNCRICAKNPIPAPTGSTSRTRFTCRHCVARIWRHRNEVRIRRDVEEHLPETMADDQIKQIFDSQARDYDRPQLDQHE